jgi:outer membrane autotransporter protein
LVTGDVVGGTGTLTNNSTIMGSGTLGNGQIAIINGNLINANLNGQTLTVNPTSFTNNVGSIARASNGGILDFTGNVTNNGTLDAAATSTIDVAGTLSGTGLVTGNGTLVTPTFTSNGTVTPGTGGAPGTLAITGNYTQAANGTLVIQVNGTTPGTGYSVLNVSGTANLGGNLQLQSNGLFVGANGLLLTFLNATTVNNTFAALNNLSGVGFNVIYNANNVQLQVTQLANGFARPGLTPNQLAVAVNLDQGVPTATGSFATLIGALQFLPAVQLPGVLDEASPQSLQVWRHMAFDDATFASQQTGNHLANGRDGITGFDGSQFHAMDSTVDPSLSQIKGRLLAWSPTLRPGLLSDSASPVLAGVDMKEVKSAPTNEMSADQWSTFVAGDVILADLSHNEDLAHQDYTTGSVTLGADYRLDAHFTVGGLFAYGHTDADLDHIGSKTTDDSYSPGVYASYVDGGWYGNGLFSYGYNSYTSDRNINLGTLSGDNRGATQGNLYVGNLTGGYEFKQCGWKFGPVASLQYAHLDINSFTEQGPSALNVASQSDDSLRSQLGAEARYAAHVRGFCGPCTLTPHISATWQHEFMDNSGGITSQFNGSGAGSFTVQASSPERDSAFIDTGLDAQVSSDVTLFTDYQTQVGQSHFFAQSIQAGLKVGF